MCDFSVIRSELIITCTSEDGDVGDGGDNGEGGAWGGGDGDGDEDCEGA